MEWDSKFFEYNFTNEVFEVEIKALFFYFPFYFRFLFADLCNRAEITTLGYPEIAFSSLKKC